MHPHSLTAVTLRAAAFDRQPARRGVLSITTGHAASARESGEIRGPNPTLSW